MQNIINQIVEIIKDYRISEGFGISSGRVERWIAQFDLEDREFILTELKNILQKRYYSIERVKGVLVSFIEYLYKHFGYQSVKDFCDETVFLDLQPPIKSQRKLLELLGQVLQANFNYNIDNCGSKEHKNFVYLDDILCTGNTLYQDIKEWINTTDSANLSFLDKLKSGNIRLVFAYIFIHIENYDKKLGQFYYNVDKDFRNMVKTIGHTLIDKQLILPIETNQPQMITLYQAKVIQEADQHAKGKNYSYQSAFYREQTTPNIEDFFTSPANRIRFENIVLKKGVEIVNKANVTIPNIRPLGFSLKAYKDFGFGTLCFTWRNVPNNTPLIFWYSGGGFFPLFQKNQTN